MAKAKEPSIKEALNTFKDAMTRSGLSEYTHVNRVLLSKTPADKSVLISVEDKLWNELMEDKEISLHIRELDISDEKSTEDREIFSYADDLDSAEWVELPAERLMKGEVFRIDIDGLEYQIILGRELLPIKLKKAESNNVYYRVLKKNGLIMLLMKKHFSYPLDECGFTIIKAFKVL